MSQRVCPWWLGYLLLSPLRRWIGEDPVEILSPCVREGMTVLEPGPGMGFFTIPMARMVGDSGRIIAVDLQPKMIESLKRRARKAKVAHRIDARVTTAESMRLDDVSGKIDFTLAFAMVHEFPDELRFFSEVAQASKPGAQVLLAEPAGHVTEEAFSTELSNAAAAGFRLASRLTIRRNRAALLIRR